MVDFRSILSTPMASVEAPKPPPVGTYQLKLGQYKQGTTQGESKTPYIEIPVTYVSPCDDVDTEQFEEFGGMAKLAKSKNKITFYLTEDSIFRLKNFLENTLQIDTSSMTLQEAIAGINGAVCLGYVKHELSKKDGQTIFATIDAASTAPVQ